ncbi:cell division protein FtsL [Candidatus Pelagibacter communis]|uniref:cell division protein FtsL n=1 Tax=Pelagibacter ubique TaxID=198252 RepID=UPI00094D9E10|nr:cell division protein FtsL [Candidatus Pelagibacter ubique]
MKKFALALVIFLLVLSTAIIKNTTKQIEDEIFTAKENIRVLKSEFENVSLEYDYLSSSERLIEYQSQYFEDELIQININDIKIYNISDDINKIQNFKIIKE